MKIENQSIKTSTKSENGRHFPPPPPATRYDTAITVYANSSWITWQVFDSAKQWCSTRRSRNFNRGRQKFYAQRLYAANGFLYGRQLRLNVGRVWTLRSKCVSDAKHLLYGKTKSKTTRYFRVHQERRGDSDTDIRQIK